MPTNEIATMHLLNHLDSFYIHRKVEEVNERIKMVCEENKLEGGWTVSPDLKWLVKTGD